jgi:hypothetical protein
MVMGLGRTGPGGGLMPDIRGDAACCDRCAGGSAAVRIARRRLLKAAVFSPPDSHGGAQSLANLGLAPPQSDQDPAAFPTPGMLPRAVTGTVVDVSPHFLVIGNGTSEERFALTPDAVAWRGAALEPAAVRPGDHAVVRLHRTSRDVADRIWANIGRVAGTIIERTDKGLLIDEGATKKRQVVIIPARASVRIQVRFPILEPGYLIDVIGLRRGGALEALIPATYQPAYRVDQMPPPTLVSGHVPNAISGSATWHEPADEPPGVLGLAYPALDPEVGCAEGPGPGQGAPGQARLPYLSIGSILQVRNDCTGSSCMLPVTSCAAIGRLFSDRCVTCGTSPRGRVADLSQASFVALGGELELGCFNATITIGG